MIHGVRYEFTRDGGDALLTARAEDDHGETIVTTVRCADVGWPLDYDAPVIVKARKVAAQQLEEWTQ